MKPGARVQPKPSVQPAKAEVCARCRGNVAAWRTEWAGSVYCGWYCKQISSHTADDAAASRAASKS